MGGGRTRKTGSTLAKKMRQQAKKRKRQANRKKEKGKSHGLMSKAKVPLKRKAFIERKRELYQLNFLEGKKNGRT